LFLPWTSAIAAPLVSEVALMFAPRDYLLLALMGLLLVASLSGESMAKGIFCAAFGACIGMVGMDPMTAEGRFTFDTVMLLGGIPYVVAMIGFFGVSEALFQLHHIGLKPIKQDVSRIIPSWSVVLKYLPLSIRTSFIGVFIGALPGTGGDIASLMAYDHAKRSVKNPSKPFGEGAYEGLVAPESANNAAVGGAYIPMLTLGMPGDAVTAVIIGALYIHGLKPGPMMDVSYRRAMISVGDSSLGLMQELVTSPISLILSLVVIWLIVSQTPLPRLIKARFSRGKAA
jgi:putative tricarboxylic transport membrane protein